MKAWLPLCAALFLASCSVPADRGPAPAFTLPDLSGKPVSLSDFSGKVVLVDFWATWCRPCQEELPELDRLQKVYGPRGLTVVGVSMDAQGADIVRRYVLGKGVAYPILLAEGRPVDGYRVTGLPTAFLIDRQGRLVRQFLGPKSFDEVSRAALPLLAASAKP